MLKLLTILLGITLAIFAVDAAYLAINETYFPMKVFHGLHVLLVVLGFLIAFFGYREFKKNTRS